MAAPKGNQNALGCETSGRPPKYDAIAMAKALEEWSKKDTSFKLAGFCVEQDICDFEIYDMVKRSVEFSRSLRMAKLRLSERRDALANSDKLHIKMWERYADNYDPFLLNHEETKKDNDSKRKVQEENSKPQNINLVVSDGLSAGLNISTKRISSPDNSSAESRD